MANTKNAKKAERQAAKRRIDNRLHAKTTRNLVRDIRATTSKADAEKALPEIIAKLDKLAKKNVIHKNKAANLKSSITKQVAKLK